MNPTSASRPKAVPPAPSPGVILGGGVFAILAFHGAHRIAGGGWLIAGVPFGLLPLALLRTGRQAFYSGLAVGLACAAPPLAFFWGIFGAAALLLWGVLAFWVGCSLALIRAVRLAWGNAAALGLAPILWTGCEYFRSELYFLRFSWLNSGYALDGAMASSLLPILGVYGVGLVLWFAAAIAWLAPGAWRAAGPALAVLFLGAAGLIGPGSGNHPTTTTTPPQRRIQVAGAQTEETPPSELTTVLDRLVAAHPGAELLVLPEYSLLGEPGRDLRAWCRSHGRHLVVGGKEPRPEGGWYNTAFVLDPRGEVVFRQAKSVPIQFFDDGLPAPGQALWNSPWGAIGIAICYDLSYTRVMDRLVRAGAVALVIPTMDAMSWGAAQHALHARVAPARAAEYGIPIVRVASSGVSQIVDAHGHVTASAPFGGDEATLAGEVTVGPPGRLPWDRVLAPACTGITACLVVLLPIHRHCRRLLATPAAPSLLDTP